jgi:hypothetical protein
MKIFVFLFVLFVNNAFADECDPFARHSLFSAMRCDSNGGYDKHNSKYVDAIKLAEQSLIKDQEMLDELEKRRKFLLQMELQFSNLVDEITSIESGLSELPSKQFANKLKIIKRDLIARGQLDVGYIDNMLKKYPNDPMLVRQKTLTTKIINTILDIVIPQSPLDLIPLKKAWKLMRAAYGAYDAIKDNWFYS